MSFFGRGSSNMPPHGVDHVFGDRPADDGLGSIVEKLDQWGVYEAEWDPVRNLGHKYDRISRQDALPDPVLRIHNPNKPNAEYWGHFVYSTNKRWGPASNGVRGGVRSRRAAYGRLDVKVIGIPKLDDGRGHYSVVLSFEINPKQAGIVTGDKVFRILYIEKGRGGPHPFVQFMWGDGKRGHGLLLPTRKPGHYDHPDEQRKIAENEITEDMIYGNTNRSPLELESYVLARLTGQTPSGTNFFEPVVNFMDEDQASTPDGRRLITRVEGYDKGALIYDLPITAVAGPIEADRDKKGMGHVKRPDGEDVNFWYKPVFVIGAENHVGNYVGRAEIVSNGAKVILARMIDSAEPQRTDDDCPF